MTLPSSFPLSVSQINVELGRSSGAAFSISGTAERALAGKPSGAISFSDFLGKSNGPAPEYLGEVLATTGGATASATGFPLGSAVAGRRIFILVHWAEGGVHRNITSASIAGVSATIHLQTGHTGGLSGFGVAIISAVVPTGTTGTIHATFDQTDAQNVNFSGFKAVGLTNTSPHDTDSAQTFGIATTLSVGIDVPAGGFVIAGYSASANASSAVTWIGVTEQYDSSGGASRISAGMGANLPAQTNRTITASIAGASDAGNGLVVLSWV